MAAEAVLSSVLEALLEKLSSSIGDELGLLLGVEKGKEALESNLSAIRAVLQDAENRQVNDKVVKDWLRKLKDAAYDAEDLVDEFVFEARRRVVENQDGMGKKVCSFFSPSNRLAFRRKMAHRMKDLVERFDGIAKEKERYQLKQGCVPVISSTRETTSIVDESSVYGRDNEKEKLIDSLTKHGNESVLSIIPVVGMGGLGKTTLAQLVYNDEKSVRTHFNLKMWVYVSENFDLGKLLKEILESAIKDKAKQVSMDLLQTRLREELSGKRYLLVLDDVWNDVRGEFVHKWHTLKTWLEKCGSMGSKVLVTTRDEQVADIVRTLPTHQLGKLSTEDSWRIFEKLVNPEQNLPQNLLSIGEEMVGKCGGLPLAVKTLGGLMSSRKTEPYWESVKNREFWQLQDNNERVLSILRLSYDHLASSLKQCFAYCAVIPKGRRFNKDVLIIQWIAQGFIHSNRENELLEEKGEEFFEESLRRSLFQFDGVRIDINGKLYKMYKMHDLIHDLLKSVAGEEFIIVKASIDTIPSETRHLALMEEDDEWVREPKNLDALKKCKKLRSMITAGPIDINVCLSFRCLRMLDLSWSGIHFLPNSIDKLRHLRYFDISHTLITELPETICNLHNLQTLRVIGTRLQKLPKNMKRMISLRHIKFHEWEYFSFPKGIGKLTFLRTLPKFIIAKESGARIEELKDLSLLWGNIHIGGLDNIGSVECAREADLKAKKHVNSLKLSWSSWYCPEGNAKEVIEVLEPHSDLKELSVENYGGLDFPSWITNRLTKLKKISLLSCYRCEHLPPLGQLPFLESLEIMEMDALKYMVDFDGSQNYEDLFPSLKYLCLCRMRNLERWSSPQEDGDGDEQGRERDKQVIFKCLRTLKIDHCPNLVRPPWLPLLPRLESLEIAGMGWDMIEIPTSQSLMKVELDEMRNLERWSPHQADDGTPVIFCSVRTLSISDCPKLICLPMFLLPALEELKMSKVGCERIEFSRSHSLKSIDLFDMPNLERWSLQEVDDDDKDEQVTFDSLCTLRISKCPKLIWRPQFLLPALEELNMEGVGWDKLEFSTSKSLKKVELTEMPNLEIWSPQQADDYEQVVFDGLVELVVKECPRMVRLPHFLPSLQILKISESNEVLLASVANYTSLFELFIEGLLEVKHFPDELGPNHISLHTLVIRKCPKLISLSNQLENLLALKKLIVEGCNDLVLSLQQQQRSPLNSLEVLEISHSCEKQNSLPGDGIILPSLKELRINSCKNIESVSADMLKNLTVLSIVDSPKVLYSLVSLENLKSLQDLTISGCPESVMMKLLEPMESLTSLTKLSIEDCPDMRSLPKSVKTFTSLTSLKISKCPAMMSLPEWVGDLTLLDWLYMDACPAMMSLPEELQCLKNLKWLHINQCPALGKRLQRNKGQDWHRVARLQDIYIFRRKTSKGRRAVTNDHIYYCTH